MSELVLYIGNRNYSSWSLRAWLALEQSGLEFRETMIYFDEDSERQQRLAISPTGRVPVLVHDGRPIWDSLAIGEYVAELAPDAELWPADRDARARARALCAEMHSGFFAVRNAMPMNIRGRARAFEPDADTVSEIRRLTEAWADTRREFGSAGPYLFGARSLADAFFAPVATRFRTYGVTVRGEAAAWMSTILALPAMRRWEQLALAEGHPEADDELL